MNLGKETTKVVRILASSPSYPGFDSQPNFYEKKLSMLLSLINSTVQRNVVSGLRMLDRSHLILASGKLVLHQIKAPILD